MSVQKVNQTTGATTPIAGVPAKKINGIQDTINKNGAKNLLPNNGPSETVGNITFTRNADGSVTINGTNNNGGLVFYKICENIAWGNTELNIGITSFPTEARYENYLFSLEGDHSVTFTAGQVAFGYTVSNTTTWIAINDGVTVNNLTVYPMVRLASDTDNTYVPYAMTNKELTDASVTVVALNSTYVNTGTIWYVKRGKQVILNIDNLSITASATQSTALNSDKLPKPITNGNYHTRACGWTAKSGNGGVVLLEISSAGNFTLGGYLPTALTETCYGQLTYFTNE